MYWYSIHTSVILFCPYLYTIIRVTYDSETRIFIYFVLFHRVVCACVCARTYSCCTLISIECCIKCNQNKKQPYLGSLNVRMHVNCPQDTCICMYCILSYFRLMVVHDLIMNCEWRQ